MRIAVKSKPSLVTLMSLVILGQFLSVERASAETFLCDATQASKDVLPLLESDCPIGVGMWGKKRPDSNVSQFWIQCGVFSAPLTLNEAKEIYPKIDSDVWAKPEGNVYRCLIGPYKDFSKVKQDLANVKQLPKYEEAFVRQIINDGSKGKGAMQAAAAPSDQRQTSESKAGSKSTTKLAATEELTAGVSIRHKIVINGVEYTVPYSLYSNDQFYMEHELPWNRMSYDMAYQTCEQMGMRLASNNEWQSLLNANVMMKDKWPVHLPYWGEEKTGLFYTGKVKSLKGSSLLNVMCVK
ncbi:SPOR domain-containing protein [Vibrio zhanjiangensis]|nr:SPOR domain-containing protein [Vibrio zhanjiangensis]